jgi:type II secretory pathway pseudopilin PulG
MHVNGLPHTETDQSGFAILAILAVIAMFSALFAVSMSRMFDSTMTRQSLNSKLSRNSIGRRVEMLYFQSPVCRTNLTSSGFGVSVQELNAKSASGSLGITGTNGGSTFVYIAKGMTVDNLKVTSITIAKTVSRGAGSLVADLEIQTTRAGTSTSMKPVTVPFYFTFDGGGNLTDCYATDYVDSTGQPGTITLEDQLCVGAKGPGMLFNPSDKTCISSSDIAGLGP